MFLSIPVGHDDGNPVPGGAVPRPVPPAGLQANPEVPLQGLLNLLHGAGHLAGVGEQHLDWAVETGRDEGAQIDIRETRGTAWGRKS